MPAPNHPRRSPAHNLPIGTLHYSCLQLQPANQPDALPRLVYILHAHPTSFPPAVPLAAFRHTALLTLPSLVTRSHSPLFASVKFSCCPHGGFELTINFGRARHPFRPGPHLSAVVRDAPGASAGADIAWRGERRIEEKNVRGKRRIFISRISFPPLFPPHLSSTKARARATVSILRKSQRVQRGRIFFLRHASS